jgi:hypothetical protein
VILLLLKVVVKCALDISGCLTVFSGCVLIRGEEENMREIQLFSCNIRIVPIGWSFQHPIIRDRKGNVCEG